MPAGVDVEIDIVGDGPDGDRLQRLSGSLALGRRVRFHRNARPEEAARIAASAHVLLLPAVSETDGSAAMGAMAAAIPLILTDVALPPEIVPAGAGLRVPSHEPQQMAADIGRLLTRVASEESLRMLLARGACEHVRERLSWTSKASRMLALYRHVVKRKPRGRARRPRIVAAR